MKKILSLFLIAMLAVFLCGCDDSDDGAYYDGGGGGYVPVVDEYYPYIAVVDYNNHELILVDRDNVDYNDADVYTETISLNNGPRTVAYSHYYQYLYVGCGNCIDTIDPYSLSIVHNESTDDTVFLASDFYSTVFGSYDSLRKICLMGTDDYGGIWDDYSYAISGNAMHTAVSPYGVFAAATTNINTVAIYNRDAKTAVQNAGVGYLGIDILDDGLTFSIDDSGYLVASDFYTPFIDDIDLYSDMVNPWGVAAVQYSDNSIRVFVTDNTAEGKICIYYFDQTTRTLSYEATISNVGMYPKHISRAPEGNYLYVANQGDGTGTGCALLRIDPTNLYVDRQINLGGRGSRLLEGLTVMPVSEDWQ